MCKRLTTEQFINRAKIIHEDKYDYSKVNYVRGSDKVIITCPIHGDFLKTAQSHLQGLGCRECYIRSKSLTTEDFIKKSKRKHKNFYSYSKVDYIKGEEKVVITCPIHGDFLQQAQAHLHGNGCYDCNRIGVVAHNKKTTEQFIEEAKEIHNKKYLYDKVDYKSNKIKVIITCPEHGEFKQTPAQHLKGTGCIACGNKHTGWSPKKWHKAGKNSRNFDSYKVYVIKCWNEKEEFYKIGKTFRKLEDRFKDNVESLLPYNWKKVESFIFNDGISTSHFERELQKLHNEVTYTPNIFFNGHTECFSEYKLK